MQDEPSDAFKAWGEIIKRNKDFQNSKLKPEAPLVEFYYAQTSMTDFD
ncbi:hypothetical protein KPSA1_07401 [Pseudomonas syringae pv. actinidiae]|uniref:Uncharacterized protein n=1 Tax=Pseudomonas syringae pv. actinidiae TaxID=103796 RepID=A0A2V0QM42_PSESF|nr:hypothetical protein KPSA1_07401 [Pseudomonas syringae pv. actinidiae]